MSRTSRTTTMSATRGRIVRGDVARVNAVRVGSCDADEVSDEIHGKLKNYISGFMDDPAYVSKGDEPSGRDHWPAADGSPVDAWDSPLAHRRFFDWIANGATCVDAGAMKNLLDRIGMDLEVSCLGTTHDVADGLIHAMNKGDEDGCTTWPEYLNSIFRIGPVSDPGQPKEDPTIAQLAAERGDAPPPPVPGKIYLGEVARRIEAMAGVKAQPIPYLYAGDGKGKKKDPTERPTSSTSTTTIALVAGGLVVAGVIAWKVLL